MICSTENQQKNFYIVSGGSWEACVLAKDAIDASALGLQEALEKYGTSLTLGNCLTVNKAKVSTDSEELDVDIDIFYVPSVLADIGKNELAKQLDEILRNNEKKLDNRKMTQ